MSEITVKVITCSLCGVESEPTPSVDELEGWIRIVVDKRPYDFCNTCRIVRKLPLNDNHVTDLWRIGTQFTFVDSRIKGYVFGGLFIYHGLGTGLYYSEDGWVYSCASTGATRRAQIDNVKLVGIDSFAKTTGGSSYLPPEFAVNQEHIAEIMSRERTPCEHTK